MPPEPATTAGGLLLVPAILTPIAGMILSFVLGGRWAGRVALAMSPVWLAIVLAIAVIVWRSGTPVVYVVGAVAPPLGIALEADGISAAMLVVTALILPAACLFARDDFAGPGRGEARGSLVFWIMLQAIGAALSLLFLGRDLFNLYVGVELLTFAAAPLVCVKGSPETLAAALRYLLFALIGSAFYLLGVALLYGTYGTLDIPLLAERVRSVPSVWLAAALMTTGMMAKTALFPLHLWLPPAHANAPPAASAVLSGLVVKGSFFVIVRLWFDMLPGLPLGAPGAFAGLLGSAAILFGGVLALRQERLKLLVAYSTIAQIGYLFLIFPLGAGAYAWSADGWAGGFMQVFAHAFAKAAMFLSAGLIAEALGHDRLAGFAGIGRAMPMTLSALGLAGLSLTGLPPSGGFAAKWLYLRASVAAGQWLWVAVILAGGLLAAAYVFRILTPALYGERAELAVRPRLGRQAIALALALAAIGLGFAPQAFFDFLEIGRPALAAWASPA